MDELELVKRRRQGRLQVRLGDRAPLPRRVLAPVGQRRVPRLPRARTERIHLGSGIFNPLPAGEPPGEGRRAGRDARPPLARALRVRHRPRRGQPRDPRLPPRHRRTSPRHARSGKTSSREFPKMWMQDEYEGYEGKYWSLPPRKILPKPYEKPHPPMWYAAGNTSQLRDGRAAAASACSASRSATSTTWSRCVEAYKNDDRRTPSRSARSSTTTSWSPTRGVRGRGRARPRCKSTVDARAQLPAEQRVPLPRHVPAPRRAPRLARADPRLRPPTTIRGVVGQLGAVIVRRPRRGARRSASAGRAPAPTSSCSASGTATQEETLETIRLMGEHVIPKIDTDPVHRTTRLRRGEGAKI